MIYLALLSLAIWIGLVFFHKGFWRADQFLPAKSELASAPDVTAVIPARNEAESIADCVRAILNQNYPGKLHVIVVNDNSEDETASLALEALGGRGEVINAPALRAGWSGKLWALSKGVEAAGGAPKYLWFSDADIVHGPDVLSRLIFKAEGEGRALVSLMVRLRAKTWLEKLVVPAFVFFFQKLYPFPAVNNPKSRYAGAAGGCVLIERQALEDIGGIAAIKDRLIDDCALGIAVKSSGRSIWLGHGLESYSLRGYDTYDGLAKMITRTAFAQLGYSVPLLILTLFGMGLIYALPPLAVVTGALLRDWAVLAIGLSAWMLMILAYRPSLRLYGQSILWGLLLPFTALLFEWLTFRSALAHWKGGHTGWKGRDYATSGDKFTL